MRLETIDTHAIVIHGEDKIHWNILLDPIRGGHPATIGPRYYHEACGNLQHVEGPINKFLKPECYACGEKLPQNFVTVTRLRCLFLAMN